MKQMDYNGQGHGKRGQRIKYPIIVEHRLKHEDVGFAGGKEEMGECSKNV
jgi:hypothetical protein